MQYTYLHYWHRYLIKFNMSSSLSTFCFNGSDPFWENITRAKFLKKLPLPITQILGKRPPIS